MSTEKPRRPDRGSGEQKVLHTRGEPTRDDFRNYRSSFAINCIFAFATAIGQIGDAGAAASTPSTNSSGAVLGEVIVTARKYEETPSRSRNR